MRTQRALAYRQGMQRRTTIITVADKNQDGLFKMVLIDFCRG
jgi:hypothetical protein